jgi:hypothetical protein
VLPLLKGLSEAMIPEGLASPRPPISRPHSRWLEQGAVGRHGPSAPHSLSSPPGGSAAPGAGCGRSQASLSPVLPAGGPDSPAPHSAGPWAHPDSGCSPGRRRGFQNQGSSLCPQGQPSRSQVRPSARPAHRPRAGARKHLCLPFLPAARSLQETLSDPPLLGGGGAEQGPLGRPRRGARWASRRRVRGAPRGRAACARQRRPCVPYAASGARPPLFSFPGSLAVSVRGSARAHKELRRRLALGLADGAGGGGAPAQPGSGPR